MTLTIKDMLFHKETLEYLGYRQGRSLLQHTAERGDILPVHVKTNENIGDVFTKPLCEEKF
eukprot:2313850-Rhodomonas_salina.1